MDVLIWPFMFLCLNGCYGPPQTLRGQVERLPETALPVPAETAAGKAGSSIDIGELVRLASEIADPAAWAERVFVAGRPDLLPSRLLELNRRGVPAGHLDALYVREMRAREADCASRVAEREKQLARRCDEDLRRSEELRPMVPPYPVYPYPGFVPAPPYVGPWWHWR